MEEGLRLPSPLRVWSTLGMALRVYRLLFQRSVTTAAVVFAGIALINIAQHATSASAAQGLAVVSVIVGLAGTLVVQGALVEIVRNIHEGKPPERIGELFRRGGSRVWPLLGASLLWGVGVFLGLLLFIIPGLIVAARWSLLAPLVVLERRGVRDARRRSSALVKGQTEPVLGCIVLMYLVTGALPWSLYLAHVGFATAVFLGFVWNALTAPFEAHVLTVIYYRLADPERPVIDPQVLSWRSVWEGR